MTRLPSSSRRDFVKTLSVGLAAGAAAGGFYSSSPAKGAEKSSLGFALVGLGSLGTHQIAPGLLKTQHCHLAGLVTGTPDKGMAWANRYGIDPRHLYSYQTFDQIIDDDSIDVVYIALPNAMHEEFTVRAAVAGKHVLCEKPMANSTAECQRMIEACRAASRQLAIGYRCQFDPRHVACKTLLQRNGLGAIRAIDAGFGYQISNLRQWRLQKPLAGGGALMELGIDTLQACRYLTGREPVSVTAQETKTDHVNFADIDESMVWTMNFSDGLVAHCRTTYSQSGHNQVHIEGERGYVKIESAFRCRGMSVESSRGMIQPLPVDPFAAEMDAFAQSIIENGLPSLSGEEGLRDLRIIEAIYRSAQEGTTVSLV